MDAIWNLTRICPWNCVICCVSAIPVTNKNKNEIQLEQKKKGKELTFGNKLKVLTILAEYGLNIDFSGGDPLYYEEDFRVIEKATQILPPERLSISMTGSGKVGEDRIEVLKKVGIVEFTLDNLSDANNFFRPRGYNASSMTMMKKCVKVGIKVRAVTTLHQATVAFKNLKDIHEWLCKNGINEWAILKFCPTGRAIEFIKSAPSERDYLEVMKFLRGLDNRHLKVAFHHPLGILENKRKCHAVVDSIGILPDGEVTACAWALDNQCRPFHSFRLGKLPEDNLTEIINWAKTECGYSEKVEICRITSYLKKQERIV